jgi:hypothetical protein
MAEQSEQNGMHRRRVKLQDGRYMIFYTFDELPAAQTEDEGQDASASKREPEPQPVAEEERRV